MAGKTYKLRYFRLAAMSEPICFLLSYAGKDFEDIRVPFDEWSALKPQMPFGKLPVLEIDGKMIHQSKAISRYLAKSVNLAGADDWESLQIDITVDTVDDLRKPLGEYFWDRNETSKAAKKDPLFKQTIPFYLERLDAQVKKNNGHFVNGKMSWADLYFVSLVSYLSHMASVDNIVAKYPNLQKLHDKVMALPKIATYVSKRPDFNKK